MQQTTALTAPSNSRNARVTARRLRDLRAVQGNRYDMAEQMGMNIPAMLATEATLAKSLQSLARHADRLGIILDYKISLPPLEDRENTPQHLWPTKRGTSGVRGVSWNKQAKKWTARVGYKGLMYYIGTFDKIETAAYAVEQKRNELLSQET